jgi:hypothetical protein
VAFLVAALALIAADSGSGRPLRDHVSRIEINHVVNAEGEVTLDQVIFWDFSPSQSCYVVRAWRTHKHFAQSPWRAGPSLYRTCWHDSRDGNAMREVTAGSFIETWTDHDPESNNQAVLDRNLRRELSQPKARRSR